MARYSEQEKLELRRVSIVEIMALLGKRTEHNRNNMYYSPFRDESTPSFHINLNENTWFDFGTNQGGGVVDFVCQAVGCARGDAYDFLASVNGMYVPGVQNECVRTQTANSGRRAVSVLSTSKDFRYQLISYASSRGIPKEILRRYCDDITYSIEGFPGRTFYAIGFKNNAGGYNLRSRDYKMCSSSTITTLSQSGEFSTTPSSNKALVFEGFMDFLSYMTLRGRIEPGYDICVLNSVANLEKSTDWLAAHEYIGAYLDNDKAGKEACRLMFNCVSEKSENVCMCDLSEHYSGYKDLNEMLTAMLRQHQSLTIKYQSLWNNPFQKTFRRD